METLLSQELVGRQGDLASVTAAVGEAARSGSTLVAVVGEPGIGKSRLLQPVLRSARELGLNVLLGRAVQGPGAEAFRPLSEALLSGFHSAAPPRDRELLPLLPTLAHLVPGWSQRPAPSVSVLSIAEALLRLLTISGESSGTLLAVEDVQWADSDTVAVLDYLASSRSAQRLALLLTVRSEPCPALTVVRRLADQRAARVIELGALNDDETDALVRSCLGVDAVSSELLRFVRERADGVPFLVEELLAGLARSGGIIRRDEGWQVVGSRLQTTVPVTLADSIERRVRDLHPRSRQILFAAALLGRQFDAALLPQVTGDRHDVVLAALREAMYAQLLESAGGAEAADGADGTVRFRHALTRDSVIALMLPPERVRLSRAAAAAVEHAHPDLPGGWLDLAAELAQLAGDPSHAVTHLVAAADRARRRGALATAAARLEAARSLTAEDDDARLEVDERLAQAWALTGETKGATRLGEQALQARRARADRPTAEIDLLLTLARVAVTTGDWDAARRRADDAAQRAATLGDRGRRARALSLGAHTALEAGDLAEAERLAAEALHGSAPPEARCEALEIQGRIARLGDLRAAEAAFTAELRTAEEHDLVLWRVRALHELGTVDLLETMRTDRLEAARHAAVEAGIPATAAVVDFHLASARIGRGDVQQAREAAARAVAAARRMRLAILPFALVVLARTYAHDRRPADVEAVLAEARAAAPDDPTVEAAAWGHARALLALHQADRQSALAALERTAALLDDRPDQDSPWWGLWALMRTVSDIDGAAARRFAASAAGSGTVYNRAMVAAAEAVAAGREGRSVDAAERFAEGFAQLDACQQADWLRHLLRWVVAPAALADRWGDPVTWMQDAVRWFGNHGHGPLASSCRVLLREAGAPAPRRGRGSSAVPDQLRRLDVTSREVDVLRLVADGLTNREIAERLVLSPKTVEGHVSRLLAKTGTGDRRELTELLARS